MFQVPADLRLGSERQFDADWLERAAAFEADDLPAEDLPAFVTYALSEIEGITRDLADDEVAYGINVIFNGSHSNTANSLLTLAWHYDEKHKLISAIFNLYERVFRQRCSQRLGHLSECGSSLDAACYMLWDATALSSWAGLREDKHKRFTLL